MRTAATIPLLALATLTAASLAASLAGCSSIPALNPPVQAVYTTWNQAEHSPDPSAAVPDFVPHDATDLYVRVRDSDGAAIITYTSKSAPMGCSAGTLSGKPALDANWWPVAKPPANGTLCASGWRLYEVDRVTYGWRAGR
jgi:hypothetical protein